MDVDQIVRLALEGYGWLPNRRREAGGGPVRARLLGQPVVGLCGPEAARFFYDAPLSSTGARPMPRSTT